MSNDFDYRLELYFALPFPNEESALEGLEMAPDESLVTRTVDGKTWILLIPYETDESRTRLVDLWGRQ
jgi:hypothetical protein